MSALCSFGEESFWCEPSSKLELRNCALCKAQIQNSDNITKIAASSTPPKKPPRRRVSLSPKQYQEYKLPCSRSQYLHICCNDIWNKQHTNSSKSNGSSLPLQHSSSQLKSQLIDSDASKKQTENRDQCGYYSNLQPEIWAYDCSDLTHSGNRFQYAAENGTTNTPNLNGSDDSAADAALPKASIKRIIDMVNPILKSYNPARKLIRNRNKCSFSDEKSSINSESIRSWTSDTELPLSPTNYAQPPTPEHAPPSVHQAERLIYERIRPLNQEYKRWSAMAFINQQQQTHQAIGASAPMPITKKSEVVGSQCSSLSSSRSYPDSNFSANCAKEYIGGSTFAGLFKGCAVQMNRSHESLNNKDCRSLLKAQAAAPPILTVIPRIECIKSVQVETETYSKTIKHQERIKNYFDRRYEDDSMQHTSSSTQSNSNEQRVLSPFNEEEAWKCISEIMESFGSSILNDTSINFLDSTSFLPDFDYIYNIDNSKLENELENRLRAAGLLQLRNVLFENGYDNYKFLNGILVDRDIEIMNITNCEIAKLLIFVKSLPVAKFQPYETTARSALGNNLLSLSEWLSSIDLCVYTECFEKHLYKTIESVRDVWDVELVTVLGIKKLGHRRRILQSLAHIRKVQGVETKGHVVCKYNNIILSSNSQNEFQRKPITKQISPEVVRNELLQNETKENIQKTNTDRLERSSPKTQSHPEGTHNLETHETSSFLLGLSMSVRRKWLQSALELVKEQVKFQVYYLGSTVIKTLRGTESIRSSIHKFKLLNPITSTRMDKNQNLSKQKSYLNYEKCTLNQHLASRSGHVASPVVLAISKNGVEFIDVASKHSICKHEMQNINSACQDFMDLSYFAYITTVQCQSYCHVFYVNSTDLATDIVLTIGQAFEVAYQLAFIDNSK